eukprot:9117854-Pyramimonas_sp.AAC.1
MRAALRGSWYEPGKVGSAWISSCLHGGEAQDPQIAALVDPVYQWGLLCWDSKLHARLQMAWQRTAPGLLRAAHPWGRVGGPAGATILAFKNLQWA